MSSIAGSGCERIIPEEAKKTLEEIERSIVGQISDGHVTQFTDIKQRGLFVGKTHPENGINNILQSGPYYKARGTELNEDL